MTDNNTLRAAGIGGQMELTLTTLRILRSGVMAFMGHGFKGEKEILISSISSVQYRAPSFFANGYLQIAFHGGAEAKGGIFQAASDENTVLFSRGQQPEFDKLRDALRMRMSAVRP